MKLVLTYILLFFVYVHVIAQETLKTVYVTVTPNNQVTINWLPYSNPAAVNSYEIFEFGKNGLTLGGIPGTEITLPNNITTNTFDYPDVTFRPVPFIVEANNEGIGYTNVSTTIFLRTENFDECKSEIRMSWNQYGGWGTKYPRYTGNVKYYSVFDAVTDVDLSGPLPDTTFKYKNVTTTATYSFYVKAFNFNDPKITSRSNTVTVNIQTTILPAYINATNVNYRTGSVDVEFDIDPNVPARNYSFTRSSSATGPFVQISKFTNVKGTITATDPNPGNNTVYYRLEAVNSCDASVKTSNNATALVPGISIAQNQINLSWSDYLNWPAGVDHYEIFRSFEPEFAGVTPISVNSTSFNDNLNLLMGQNQGSIIYYKVVAVSGSPDNYTSVSKTVSIDVGAEVYIPNAFTPDGNNVNDSYYPSFAFIPLSSKMVIFDRYGSKVYEISNPGSSNGWNGRLANKQPAPEGTYVVIISYTSSGGMKYEKKGIFSLIYP